MKWVLVVLALTVVVDAVGHWREIPVDQENVKKVADFASKSLSQRMNSAYHSKLFKIHEARQQVRYQYNCFLEHFQI